MSVDPTQGRCWNFAWLALALAGGYLLVGTQELPIPHDAVHTYLPAAKRLMTEGIAFFLDRESYRMAPLAYVWPALWELSFDAMRLANAALFVASAAMLWRTAGLLGGARAAWLAAVLFVFHPELQHYFGAGWTEPFYVAGVSALFLASAQVIVGTRRPGRWITLGAFGLAVTLLGRPALQLLAPATLMLCLVVGWWPTLRWEGGRNVAKQLALMFALGLMPALIVVIKNGLLFGLWGVATGSGAGLYLGLHPVSQGAEPAYYGLDFDVNALAGLIPETGGDHLNLAADRFLRGVAIETLKEHTWPERVAFFARKLWWWLFHHPAALAGAGIELRGIRAFDLISIVGGCLVVAASWLRYGRQRAYRQFVAVDIPDEAAAVIGFRRFLATLVLLLGMLGLLVQLMPVLYNSRYSTGLLEPWLCVLTGVSWSLMSRFLSTETMRNDTGVRWRLTAQGIHGPAIWAKAMTLVLILATAILLAQPRRIERVSMDPLPRTMPTTILARIDATAGIETTNITRIDTASWALKEQPGALVFPMALSPQVLSEAQDNRLWRLRFAVRAPDGAKCRRADVGFSVPRSSTALVPPKLNIAADSMMHEYLIHATHELGPAGPGDLRIAYHCPVGTIVTWGGGELVRPEVRKRWQALAAPVPPVDKKVN